MTRAAITFDTGALIALERRKERAMKVYTHARDTGLAVATPNVTVAEWWRGRTDRRDAVLAGLLVEPPSDETVKLAGVALGRVAAAIDAIVAAFAAAAHGHRVHERRRGFPRAPSILSGASCLRYLTQGQRGRGGPSR